ncbi:MAG: iron-containing alcohol dehydrogenase, partial [Armatimonadetes bacterium]|nr:iron-containing alcohol dehydrogenase [Armatimonadota bacterium]
DALAELAPLVRERRPKSALLVMDATPMRRGDEDLKALVEARLRTAAPLTVARLAEPHADLATAERLAAALADHDLLISCGSGSVTDLAKYARHLARTEIPFLCLPTAASVTAFTSSLAVLLVDGVKRTLPARAPELVLVDLLALASAPPAMTAAGFGDVLARSVANADWFLAAELGMADGFSRVPGLLLAEAEERMVRQADSVALREPEAVCAVMEALLLAGLAMSLVDQTAPLSGWEHVISHFIDMTAAHDRREMGLHGEQVGVGTLIAARAYDRAWPALEVGALEWEPDAADLAQAKRYIVKVFKPYDPRGLMAAEIWRDAERKLRLWSATGSQHREFARRHAAGDYNDTIAGVRSSAQVARALSRVGAPLRFEELSRPVPTATARAAVRHSHLIRSRFTLGDLLDLCGWLTDETAADLLAE